MIEAPTHTVAFVFTDVEGSTERWERLGHAFREVLDRHDAVIRAAASEHGGYEVKTEGDAFMLAFASAGAAVRFCLAAQAALLLPVRMGVHVGEPICRPDPVTGRMDYFGPVVNKAARVGSAAHGGQVVVSEDARCTVDVPWVDLGEHRLKGLHGTHRLWQVGPGTYPPLRTQPVRRTNLVAEPTPFVGREAERDAVADALGAARLVTLVGPGGAGKTRLASEVARARVGDFAGGAWMARLAGVRNEDGLVGAVAGVLEVPLRDADPAAQVGHALGARGRLLLVLDNLEQVIATARAVVEGWLRAAPELTVLCTSREALRIPGERLIELHPLPEADGVALFLQRGRAVRRDLPADDPAIARIVARLDGLPLAIELAAARARSLPPAVILERLDRRFDLLRAHGRTGRQATLRAVLDGSWELLDDAERLGLAQLSVFRGAFSLQAAEAVLELTPEAPWALDVVTSLHDQSMVRALPDQGEARFALLESVRAYAAERLADPEAVVARHGAWYAGLARTVPDDLEDLWYAARAAVDRGDASVALGAAERAVRLLRRTGPAARIADLAALVAPLAAEDPAGAVVLARAGRALVMRDPAAAERLLEHARTLADPEDIAGAIARSGLADLARLAGRSDAARALLEDALARAVALRDPLEEGQARRRLGLVAVETGHHAEAARHFDHAVALARRHGHRTAEAIALANSAIVRAEQGDVAAALRAYEEAVALHAAADDRVNEAVVLQNLANLLIEVGRYDEAETGYRRAIVIHQQAGLRRFEGAARTNLAVLQAASGRLEEALQTLREALPIVCAAGDRRFEGIAVGIRADVHRELGDLEASRTDATAARSIAEEVGDRRFAVLGGLRLACLEATAGRPEAAGHLAGAARDLEALGDVQNLAVAQTWQARVALEAGDAATARELAARAAEALRTRELWLDLVLALAVLGLAEHARGEVEASERLAEARAVAERIGLSPRLDAARVLARLRAAIHGSPE